jgi:hypothetical protein
MFCDDTGIFFAVDFAAFPSMLVQLLEKCRQEGVENGASSPPRFILVLNCTAGGGHQAVLPSRPLICPKSINHVKS